MSLSRPIHPPSPGACAQRRMTSPAPSALERKPAKASALMHSSVSSEMARNFRDNSVMLAIRRLGLTWSRPNGQVRELLSFERGGGRGVGDAHHSGGNGRRRVVDERPIVGRGLLGLANQKAH